MNRCSGILMPVFSLPSPYGIGTLGKAAYDFADFLHAAGQRCWQMLPLGPTSYGDSPYQSFSTYAGNPYFIDLDMLIEDGLLTRDEVESQNWGTEPRYVDYGKIYESRFAVLQKAKDRGWVRDQAEVAAFQAENSRWLPDYALYMACKRHFGMRSWTEWEDPDIRLRKSPEVLERYRTLLREDVELFTYLQFLFYRQWNKLRDYLHGLDIRSSATCLFMWPWIPPTCGRSRRASSWTTSACPRRYPACRRTISAPTVSCGAIPCTPGTGCRPTASAGGSAG